MTAALRALLREAAALHAAPRRWAMLLAGLAALAAITLLALSGWFITGAALAGAAGLLAAQGFNYLLPSAAIRLLAITRTASRYGERLQGHKAALLALATVRARLFERLIGAPVAASARSSGDAAAQLIQDVEALEDRFVRGPSAVGAAAGLALAIGCAAGAGLAAALALTLIATLALLAARPLAARLLAAPAQVVRDRLAALKRDLVGAAAASADMAAYGLVAQVGARMLDQAAALDRARERLARGEALLVAAASALGGLGMVAVLALSRASLPMTMLAALAAIGAGEMLAALVRAIGRDAIMAPALARLGEIAALPHGASGLAEPLAGATIAFEAEGARIGMRRGERLAITGRTGAGKTRLLEGLAGWRDEAGMGLWIDGQCVQPGNAPARQGLFALAPQDAQLVSGTVADNLRLARPGVTDAAMWAALETACLDADVRSLPHGLLSWVGDGGARLSGGQRKRLSIARALLAGRPWLLLDEPSEGLDQATERRLCARLAHWLDGTGAGLILVTHRPAMLALAERRIDLG